MEKNKKSKTKNKKIDKLRAILVGACFLFIIGLLGILIYINSTYEDDTITNTDKYQEHESYDKTFTISAPKTWKKIEIKNSLNGKAIIELYDEIKNSYLVVLVNKKEDLNEDFNTYKTKVFSQKEEYYQIKITEYKDAEIDNYKAQYIEIYHTNEDSINTYIRSYAFETENYYGQMVIWTLKSNEEEVQVEFDNITKSLEEHN